MYIVEQQYQSDSDETRAKTVETLNNYLARFRESDEVIEEEENEEEQEENDQQSTPTNSSNQVN